MRKLGLGAKSSIIYVKVDRDSGCNVLSDLVRQCFALGLRDSCCLEFASNLPLVCSIEVENGAEDFPQLLRRDVGSAGDDSPFIVQESGSGPTAHIVTAIDVRSPVGVDSDWDEFLVHQVDDHWIFVRCVIHNVAPVAPRSRYV